MVDSPTRLVERMVGQRVTLRLKDGRRLAGKLEGIDDYMNLVLSEVDETTAEQSRHLGTVILRGSNLVTLHDSQGTPRPVGVTASGAAARDPNRTRPKGEPLAVLRLLAQLG
ncbi:Like-Sm ribonucleoprotein, eukaryotic and archaea-type, core, partial [mine drainage metagenome]